MSRVLCWWFGCEPHPQDPTPAEYAQCQRCGEIVTYEHMVGITRYNAAKGWLRYWMFRRWWPSPCVDCGKRFGHHHECLPF
jgi:hypothetical protein